MEMLDLAMKWLVAPLVGLVAWMLKRLTTMSTEIKIIEAKMEAQAEASKASHASLQQQMAQIISKLDGIESYLRKDK